MRRAVAALIGAAAAASLAACSGGDEPTNTGAESAAAPRTDHKNIAYSIGGQTVRLEDFRGAPLLLVFYRGHW